ncbi:hypothetical protein BDR04DRAFT_1164737 [Suillus decipiens]|nr:hypothetical protein BDR04DRAFT_1164737 [Suillus decipiens]
MGLAIEEAQIALLIKIQQMGRRLMETQTKYHLAIEEFNADDDPDDFNIDILDDLKDDPADFTKTSDVWTNTPELTIIPLPSNLGVD